MIRQVDAIKTFLSSKTHADLANLYNEGMEVQIMADTGMGERLETEYGGKPVVMYQDPDSGQKFKSFRIPYKAKTEPEFDLEKQMRWDLERFCLGIGMSGWNWQQKVSKFFIYDFDSIVGHSANHAARLTNTELEEVKKQAMAIPWVSVRKSTGGQGLHFYIFVDNVPTQNHNEHAALARALLGKLSVETGFDFESKIDVCGHIGWQWHRKLEKSNGEGLKIIKQGEVLKDIPKNWKDHLGVIQGRSKRAKLRGKESEGVDSIVDSRNFVDIEPEHRRVLDFLDEAGANWWWDNERKMAVCHTKDLKEAHEELGLLGIYNTISQKSSEINCFMFPLRGGAWTVRRFSQGVAEHDSWSQDDAGWTRIFFNKKADFRTACRTHDGLEVPDKGFFEFRQAGAAVLAAKELGELIEIGNHFGSRPAILRVSKDGRLVMEVAYQSGDMTDGMKGWRIDVKKKLYTYICNSRSQSKDSQDKEITLHDGIIRHLVDMTGSDAGWVIRADGTWTEEPLKHVQLALGALGYNLAEKTEMLGGGILNRWKVVNEPFKAEYLGDRRWNREGAALNYSILDVDPEELYFPTWNKMLAHAGKSLDSAVAADSWCAKAGIKNGRDYLFMWLACLFQEPEQPLPYLFFYGNQNVGKSTFHESAKLLFEKGYSRADQALTNQSNFNGELEGCVLAVIEETDFSTSKIAYSRIKDLVTSPTFQIHKKGLQPYLAPNYLHFVHASNFPEACSLGEGDTRVTMSYVHELAADEIVPKKQFTVSLEKEAQQFLTALMSISIPESNDRLRLPVIETSEKRALEFNVSDPLKNFIEEYTESSPGSYILFRDFYNRFIKDLDRAQLKSYGERTTSSGIPPEIPKGKLAFGLDKGQIALANIFWKDLEDTKQGPSALVLNNNGYFQKPRKDLI